jgi:hypothetical protein
MASETSELTFVRCPSCRSLVPVTASRCRICNNPLEGGGKAADGDTGKQPGRVRQKTVTASAEELMGAMSDAPPPVAPPSPQAFGDDGDHEEVDPLADFLQEFESEGPEPVVSAPPQPATPSVAAASNDDDDDFDAFLEELDSYDAAGEEQVPSAQQPIAKAPVEEPPVRSAPSRQPDIAPQQSGHDPLADFMTFDDDFGVDAEPQAVQVMAPPEPEPQYVPEPPAPPPVRQAPPRQQVDKRPQPQHAQAQKPQAQQPQSKQGREAQDQRPHRDQRNNQPRQGAQERRDHVQQERREAQRHEPRRDEPRKANHQGNGRPQERAQDRPNDRAQEHREGQASGPKTGKMRPGRLFGWLVSFESPDGRAIELREGKFFVTGSSIRPTDLVIEDPSISTPHALMSVSADNGLLIQDLMSERGLFVRAGERGQYKREDGVVEVNHGDWVRFGDVEFLVTVVPAGR